MLKRPLNQTKIVLWHTAVLPMLSLLYVISAQALEVPSVTSDDAEHASEINSSFSWQDFPDGVKAVIPSYLAADDIKAWSNSYDTFSLLTYSINTNQATLKILPDSFESYLGDYLPSIDWLQTVNIQWQAELGLFVINSANSVQSADTVISKTGQVLSTEFNLGFRWGTSSLDANSHFDSYSVLLGYGLADKVELNLGYSTLDVDERVYNSAFYEGTWYAGFSAKF